MTFEGFPSPTKNFFSMPNEMINIIADIKNMAELKVIIYLIRHTWGFHEYGISKVISTDEFMNGRKRQDGSRMDKGTGLSNRSVIDGLRAAEEHGYLISDIDTSDRARTLKSYKLKMIKAYEDASQGEENTQGEDASYHIAMKNLHKPHEEPSHQREEPSHRSEKDTIERHLGNTLERQDIATFDKVALRTSNVSDFAEAVKRKTEPRLPALTIETAYHIATDGYEKDDDEEPTVKMPAVKIGGNDATNRPSTRIDNRVALSVATSNPHETPGYQNRTKAAQQQEIDSQQTPDAGTRSGPASPPRGSRPDVEGSVQAKSPGDVTPAQRSDNADSLPPVSTGAAQGGRDHLNGASKVIPKRPLRKQIEKPQLTFGGQQVREWYEQARECKVRMTDKNVITLNRLADIDEMTQENLKDVLELYDADKWILEHNVTVDLQELEKQDGKFTFERGLLAVKRKRRPKAPTQNGKPDAYGNDYSLTGLLARQQKAM